MTKLQRYIKAFKMIKQAFITLVTDDASEYPQAQVGYEGKASYVTRMSPYGLCTNPPNGSLAVLMSVSGQESVKYALIDDMVNRFKNLKEGEVALFNYMSGTYVHFKENGDMDVNVENNETVNVKGDSTVNIEGSLSETIGGDRDSTTTGTETNLSTGNMINESTGGNNTLEAASGVNVKGATALIETSGGTINIKSNGGAINLNPGTGNVVIGGGLQITGSVSGNGGLPVQFTADIQLPGMTNTLTNHVHSGVTSGPNNTGGPI